MIIFDIYIFWVHIAPTYYGLMYAIGFIGWYHIINKRWQFVWERIESLFIYMFLWVVLWWRFWYILFYDLWNYISHPLKMLEIRSWWMSFHGWVIWVVIALLIYSKKWKVSFYKIADEITAILPIWLWFWRIWNYLNKELLWFSPYNWFLAVEKNGVSYFPSPLVESFLEWLVLYYLLKYYYEKKLPEWQVASLFLIFYGVFRIFVEMFFREPDANIWYIWGYFTMWEILSLPMIIAWYYFYNRCKKLSL
jgi:phosphatidylglycerol:prolipoprotein diacylglycerol transferase